LLWVCEEAHRYAPSDRGGGFGPTRKAISRIAKEGRKYGVFLGLITQRPAELDATIISQCSTLFTMRLSNDNDQSIVRAAAPDAATSLLSFVPSLGTREVFAFGAAVPVPTRLRFKELPESISPRSTALDRSRMASPYAADRAAIAAVVGRWRSATMSKQLNAYDVPRQSDETTEQLLNGRSKPDDDLDSTVTQKKSVAIRPDAYRFPIENTRQQNNGVDPIERFRR